MPPPGACPDRAGARAGHEFRSEPAVARLCADALEAVRERAVRHEEYRIR